MLALLQSQICNTTRMGCWGRRVGSDVSICTMLWDCMRDNVSAVVELKTQCHENGLLRPTCWVGRVYMHHVVRLHDRRGQHYSRAKDAMPWYWVTEADMLGRLCLSTPCCCVAWQTRSILLHSQRCNAIILGCWLGRMYLYAPFWKYKLLKNRLAICELFSYERIFNLCYELCWDYE